MSTTTAKHSVLGFWINRLLEVLFVAGLIAVAVLMDFAFSGRA